MHLSKFAADLIHNSKMATRPYEYDLSTQRLRSAGKSPYTPRSELVPDRAHMDHSPIYFDPLKTAEIRELQEEERYIHNIRKQIERIETYKIEMDKKDVIIENLQDQVKRVKRDAEDVGRMNATVDDLGGKLRKKEE